MWLPMPIRADTQPKATIKVEQGRAYLSNLGMIHKRLFVQIKFFNRTGTMSAPF